MNVLLPAFVAISAVPDPVFVYDFPLKNAAVLTMAPSFPSASTPSPNNGSWALLATTFAGFGSTPSYYVQDFASQVKAKAADVTQLEDTSVWSNQIAMVPSGAVRGCDKCVLTAGGFLVPGKSTGRIELYDVSELSSGATPRRMQISTDKKGWFYHHTEWHDMNGDGLPDVLAARATTSKSSAAAPAQKGGGHAQLGSSVSGLGELVWLEQPAGGVASGDAWVEHVVTPGPDVDFAFEDLDGDGVPELVAAQFFSSPQLVLYQCSGRTWTACSEGANLTRTVLDDAGTGPFFTVEAIDLNADGRKDLLVSNNRADGQGQLLAYEVPSSTVAGARPALRDAAAWRKHVLADGFKPNPGIGPGRGSPGAATAFQPIAVDDVAVGEGSMPWVCLSGDDGGFVALFRPTGEWQYDSHFLTNSTGTIGSPAIADIDGDGAVEIAIPFYSEGRVEVFSFGGSGPQPPPFPLASCMECLDRKDPVGLSPDSAWCSADNSCHLVGSAKNPCKAARCSSRAKTSQCKCTACNDPACM